MIGPNKLSTSFELIAECGTLPEPKDISLFMIGPNKRSTAFQPKTECGTLPNSRDISLLLIGPNKTEHSLSTSGRVRYVYCTLPAS